jgi:hypothetical protein
MRQCAKHCRYNVLIGKNLPKMYSLTKIYPLKRTFHLRNPGGPTSLIHARKTVSNLASYDSGSKFFRLKIKHVLPTTQSSYWFEGFTSSEVPALNVSTLKIPMI